MQFTDIHCHILPMVDDGPETVEEALEIIEESQKQGVRYMIVTPHYRKDMFEPSMKKVLYSFRSLKELAKERGITLFLGCEFYRESDMLEMLGEKMRPTMAGTNYVLVEFSSSDMFVTIRNYVYNMVLHGYQPIVAHVERYFSCQNVENVRELRSIGAKIQLNSASVLGKDGLKQKRFCLQLMKEDLVDFIASDTHNTSSRSQNLKQCSNYVIRKMGMKYAKRVFVSNPADILRSRRDQR